VVSGLDLREGGRGIVVVATPHLATARLVSFALAEGVALGATATMRALAGADHEHTGARTRTSWLDLSAQPGMHAPEAVGAGPAGEGS
jgi:hypothetical protein